MQFSRALRPVAFLAIGLLVCVAIASGQGTPDWNSSPRLWPPNDFDGRAFGQPGPGFPGGEIIPAALAGSPYGVGDPLYGQSADSEPGTSWTEIPYDESPQHGLAAFVGYDAWRGYPDGGWTNNGIHTGINYGTRLGKFSEWTGIGMQIGGSIGVYDWSGTDYRMANRTQATTQGFVTYGLFRKATAHSRWSAAIAHDWMINNNYSVMAEDSTLSQLRLQWGYATNDRNEFGLWSAVRTQSDTRTVNIFGPVTWRPIHQVNAYWHRKWGECGPDTWVSVGVPERDRLDGDGSLGEYIVGVFAICPLADRVSLYSMVNYLRPSAAPGDAGAKEEAWNFYTGILVYPRPIARSATIFGRRWLPQLPVANNGVFLVDASRTY